MLKQGEKRAAAVMVGSCPSSAHAKAIKAPSRHRVVVPPSCRQQVSSVPSGVRRRAMSVPVAALPLRMTEVVVVAMVACLAARLGSMA